MNGFRLSPQQRRVLQVEDGSLAERLRVQSVFRLSGQLEAARLAAAFRALVERHEILRTSFPPVPGLELPLQVPGDAVEGALQLDGGAVSVEDAAGRALELFREDLVEPLDIVHGRLLKVRLLKVGEEEHLLGWTQSALTGDVASVTVLAEELLHLYADPSRSSALEEPLQYADLAEWQNEILEGEDAAEGASFWRRQLGGSSDRRLSLERSTDAAPLPVESVAARLSGETRAAVVEFAQAAGTSPEVVLLTLWAVLLSRFADADTMTVTTSFDGRSYEGLEEAIGPFARYLPLVVHLGDGDGFAEIVGRVGEQRSEMGDWQEYFSWEDQERASDRLEHAFSYFKPPGAGRVGDLNHTLEATARLAESHSLELSCLDLPDELRLDLHYDADRFGSKEAEGLLSSFLMLLDHALADPDRSVLELPLLDAAEFRRRTAETASMYEQPSQRSILELIAAVVAARASEPAVVCGSQAVTYGELWDRAGALAARLQRKGVGRGDVVALCFERSTDLVVAVIGVLRAGAAYLPLDPGHPDDRIDFMLGDAGARLALHHERTTGRMETRSVEGMSVRGEDSAPLPGPGPSPSDPAYVIYTSGSTGIPKGVVVTHSNLLHSTRARSHFYDDPPERFLLLSPYSFDSSVAGLFWTLATGGTLIVPEEGAEQDMGSLAGLIEEHSVTDTLCLPTLYALLLEQIRPERLRTLRRVIVAGEACPLALARKHFDLRPDSTLVNEYGPTEATVWALATRLDAATLGGSVPIGRPIPYARAYLLDVAGQPVPDGVAGEIYLGGAGIARGYLGRPGLTAERFVPDPFAAGPGDRVYRTGDRGRRRADGSMEFLGRLDHQIKLRGYRIEPGEIENGLLEDPRIGQCVVVARATDSGDHRLIAYVVPAPGSDLPTHSDLREALRRRLPEYMIPGVFVPLDELPRTATGKVDRGALTEPEQQRPDLGVEYEPAAGPLESYLVQRWQEILETEPLGVHDNFFELGGNSIQAAILMNRVRGEIHDFVHVGRLFEHPTVRELAACLEDEHAEAVRRFLAGASVATLAADGEASRSVEDLSDEEVESMLDELLGEE